jgi:hypothetical protein
MIQRIQSVYLFMTTVIAVLFLSGTILKMVGGESSVINVTISGIYEYRAGIGDRLDSSLLLSFPVSLAGLIALITVFLFHNRKLQLRLSIAGLVLSFSGLLAEAYYLYEIHTRFNLSSGPGIKSIIPLLMMILLFLAYRGIKKDDQLVKSYDRLR